MPGNPRILICPFCGTEKQFMSLISKATPLELSYGQITNKLHLCCQKSRMSKKCSHCGKSSTNVMRALVIALLGIIVAGMVSCTKPTNSHSTKEDPFPVVYENELFSINLPKGWVCDSSGWKGLDSLKNVVEIYNPNGCAVWFHFVKTFMPFKWKDIDEAKEMAKTARAISGDDMELIDEIDSVEVGGYPTSILYFANYVDNDTIIQKQFVTYLQDSHIVVYFNENFYVRDWEEAQEIGDLIIGTIKLKKVVNPLENDSVLEKSMVKGLEDHPVPKKYMNKATEIIEQLSKDE